MFLIVGLGNPGGKYAHTRHNAGYEVIDRLSDKYGIDVSSKKHKGLVGKGVIEGEKVILLKPETYMNLSGESVEDALSYYKLDPAEEMIVIYDDISLSPGVIRVRPKGSAGGHNGIKSVLSYLPDDRFLRIKVGVGEKPKGWDLVDHVLGHFSEDDKAVMDKAFDISADAVVTIMKDGVDAAMNKYNGANLT